MKENNFGGKKDQFYLPNPNGIKKEKRLNAISGFLFRNIFMPQHLSFLANGESFACVLLAQR